MKLVMMQLWLSKLLEPLMTNKKAALGPGAFQTSAAFYVNPELSQQINVDIYNIPEENREHDNRCKSHQDLLMCTEYILASERCANSFIFSS
jgi:hypothetical protein